MPGSSRPKRTKRSIEAPESEAKVKPRVIKKSKKVIHSGSIINGSKISTGLKYVGAHCSAAGGVENAVSNALEMGAKSFALFLRSQRQWNAKPLEDETVDKFQKAIQESGIVPDLILPHGSYLLNLGSPKEDVRSKSRELFLNELQRCEKLGIKLYNIHPGSTCGQISRDECISFIAEEINLALDATSCVKVVLENMSRQGNTIGGDFKELKAIINQVKDKSRMGVCIDTCHAMAAGYDLSTQDGFDQMMDDLDSQIGFEYLVALHLNDSKGAAGCHLDRHENIGKGKIGLEGFKRIMKDPHFSDIPIILETPFEGNQTYENEIKLLTKMVEGK